MKDFFISYTHSDKAWAEWIAWQLEENGYSTILQEWDFLPGSNFVHQMQKASIETKTTLAVVSAKYLDKLFTLSEWAAAFAKDPTGEARKLIPIKIKPCILDGLLSQVVPVDLVNKSVEDTKKELLGGVSVKKRRKPDVAPVFPVPDKHATNKKKPFPAIHKALSEPQFSGRRFIHTQITTKGLINFENTPNPYSHLYDPTDPPENVDVSQIFCYLWLPRAEYLRSSHLLPVTPAAAICSVEPWKMLENLKRYIDDQTIEELKMPPRKLRPEYKEKCLTAIATILPISFVVAVAVPDIMLSIGRFKTEFSYQVMVSLFLKPLLEMHRKIGIEKFNLRISKIGENKPFLLRSVKNALKICFPKKGTTSADFSIEATSDEIFTNMARLLAWAVGTYYNAKNSRWISMLEIKTN